MELVAELDLFCWRSTEDQPSADSKIVRRSGRTRSRRLERTRLDLSLLAPERPNVGLVRALLDDLRHLRSELLFELLNRRIRVFDRVVQDRSLEDDDVGLTSLGDEVGDGNWQRVEARRSAGELEQSSSLQNALGWLT